MNPLSWPTHFLTRDHLRRIVPFGQQVYWKQKDPAIKMEIYDIRGNQRIEHTIRLSEISFK